MNPEVARDEILGRESKDEAQDMRNSTYTFEFLWEGPSGEVFKGPFTNHILTNSDKTEVASIAARLRGGMPVDSVEPIPRDFANRVAHLTVSMPREERPKWAQGPGGFGDLLWDQIVYELHRRAAQHEATFRGRGEDQKVGKKEGQ